MTSALAITPGDAAGIGPRVMLEALQACAKQQPQIRRILLGANAAWEFWLQKLPFGLPKHCSLAPSDDKLVFEPGVPGLSTALNAKNALEDFAQGYRLGTFGGLCTGPICKEYMHKAGFAYPGHTEFCADVGAVPKATMFFRGSELNVLLATIHVSLRQMLVALDAATVEQAVKALANEGIRYGLPESPRLLLCGLNPHAGENGLLGREEDEWLRPLAQRLREGGIQISDPMPPDTVFYHFRQNRTRYDAVVALYHDQGLIPFKMLHFDDGVNISLGLPFVRTSPDHGTAFDLAAGGVPSSRSATAAVALALDAMAQNTSVANKA